MEKRWKKFEDQVRGIAAYVHGQSCAPGRIAGNDIDGIITIANDHKVLIEITLERDLGKVRTDLTKLVNAKLSEMANGTYCKCYIVLNSEPTKAMTDGGDAANVTVCSVNSFAALFIEYERYRLARLDDPFGSAVDPQTGEKDIIAYVPVLYADRLSKRDFTSTDIAESLLAGKNVILLGE